MQWNICVQNLTITSKQSMPSSIPFTNTHAFIIDMDGVLWHGEQPVPGLADFFLTLRKLQIPFILATNNARSTPDQYVNKLAGMGVAVSRKEILTSAMATASYLAEQTNPTQTRVFVIGESGTTEALLEQGFILSGLYEINNGENRGADYVVCGLDKTLNWDKLATATLNIRAGAHFIGTNGDTTLPTELGISIGNGAILAALQAATGAAPRTIGKPEPIMYQQAIALLNVDPRKTVAIGDRLDTDILGAVRADIRSIMVLTGISSEADLNNIDYQPTWVMPDIRAITQALKNKRL
jgi:4-nitrophenyl phosphatase